MAVQSGAAALDVLAGWAKAQTWMLLGTTRW